MARHGLGLYIYNGFDHIDENGEPQQTQQNGYQQKNNGGYQRQQAQPRQQYNNQRPAQAQPQPQASVDPNAALKAQINSTTDVQALISLYLDNTAVIEANPDVKNLLTTRKRLCKQSNYSLGGMTISKIIWSSCHNSFYNNGKNRTCK